MATISEALAVAIQHHQAGRLQAAEQIYREILAVEPDCADAIHLLGVIANQVGRYDVAAEYIRRAIELKADVPAFHNNLGETYRALGRSPDAMACYRRALELHPGYAEAHSNLGIVCKDQGQDDEAIGCYRRALELKPDYAEAHNNLGIAMNDRGNFDEAVACYRRALESKPGYAEAHNNLGRTWKSRGDLQKAAACCRRALELKPDYAEACNNLGSVLEEQGKSDEAIACYRRTLVVKPDFAEAYYNMSKVLQQQGKLDEAAACWRRALAVRPDYPEALNNLGAVLKDQGNLDEGIACWRRALELKPDFAEALNNLGAALEQQGKLEETVACCRRALELKPDYADARGNLASALEELGDLPGAEASFRAALRSNPRFAMAHYQLAMLLGRKLPQADVELQRRLLEEEGVTDAERLLLHFGLAQVLDARGEYAQAADHLRQGNALQGAQWAKRGQAYDPKEQESLVSRIIRITTPDYFEATGAFGSPSELPVFVVGLPRSGTTLVEQILASHSQVFGAGEIKLVRKTMMAMSPPGPEPSLGVIPWDRQAVGRLAADHLQRLRALHATALRIVDKLPDNYLYLGLLATLFPRAKLIHCRRDLRDVAVSCWMTHFEEIRWANDQEHTASRFHQYRRIMEHWRKVLPVPLLEVDYEETVGDLEGTARRLVEFCGLEWEPACLAFQQAKRPVRTASAVQVRQPVYKTSVGRWKHYAQAMAWLFARLEDRRVASGEW